MKRLLPLCMLAALSCGLLSAAAADALPPPPPLPPPLAPGYVPRDAVPEPRGGYTETRRGAARNLTPEQRDAIRRLSQEERQALANRRTARTGEPPQPGARLSAEERRQLRDQIREEHERRGPRSGGGKRP